MKYKEKKIRCVYVIEFDNGIKVGISNNFKVRINIYQFPWTRRIVSAYYLEVPNPAQIETQIKRFFKKDIRYKTSREFISNVKIAKVLDYLYKIRTSVKKGMYYDETFRNKEMQKIDPNNFEVLKEEPKKVYVRYDIEKYITW